MSLIEKTVVDSVLEALSGSEALSAYVKSVTAGDAAAARKQFPFIAVGNVSTSAGVERLGEGGGGGKVCSFEIVFGAKSLAPGEAFDGERGILQLCEDVLSAVWPSDFGGVFDGPVLVRGVETGYGADSGGSVWRGVVRMEGTLAAG